MMRWDSSAFFISPDGVTVSSAEVLVKTEWKSAYRRINFAVEFFFL